MNLQNFKISGDLVEDVLAKKTTQAQIDKLLRRNFNVQKKSLIAEFLSHKVTQEILNPNLGNISGTLAGYGDLFGFIGFFEDSDPIGGVLNVLKESIIFKNAQIKTVYSRDVKGRFTSGKRLKEVRIYFSMPILDDFDDASSEVLREQVTRNWVKGIERGISGFNRYANYMDKGQSRRGIEVAGIIKNPSVWRPEISAFRPKPYMSKLLSGFVQKVKNYEG